MNDWTDWVKTVLTSSVVAGAVSWFTTSHKIEQELHSKQSESGYEALVEGNKLLRQSEYLRDRGLVTEAQKKEIEADAAYWVARQKIAAFGDERVVKAMSDYYTKHGIAARPCANNEKFRSDTKMYSAIRNTLGVGGRVSDEQLANLMFLCSLKEKPTPARTRN